MSFYFHHVETNREMPRWETFSKDNKNENCIKTETLLFVVVSCFQVAAATSPAQLLI